MNTAHVDALHLAELGFLQAALTDAGIESELLEKSKEIPLNVLLASLGKNRKDKDCFVNFSYIPIGEDQLDHIRLLQLFSVIPADLNPEHQDDLVHLLNAVNGQAPIGHFNLKENGEITYRYVHCVPSDESIPTHAVVEVLNLFNFTLSVFAERIEDVADGTLSLQEALRQL